MKGVQVENGLDWKDSKGPPPPITKRGNIADGWGFGAYRAAFKLTRQSGFLFSLLL